MATGRRKWAVVNGPSLLEGIILNHWRDEHRPEGYEKDLPYFMLEVGRTFSARIHGIFQVPGRGMESVILLGEFAGERLDDCPYFVLFYCTKGRHTGILEPLESLPSENEMLNTYFPDLFKTPEPSPVLEHLRSLPWEDRLQLAKNLTKDMLQRRVDTTMAYRFVLELFDDTHPRDQQVSIEIARNPDFDVERLSDVFAKICPLVTDFFRELGMKYFLTSGGRMAGGKLGSVIISLGPKSKIDFD